MKDSDFYKSYKFRITRRKAAHYKLKKEILTEVLERMQEEADNFIDIDETLDFFTRKGRPAKIQLIIDDSNKVYSSNSKPFIQNKSYANKNWEKSDV